MQELKIGVVGTGHLGRYHLQKYQRINGCRIVAVADCVEENARSAAAGCDCEILTDYRKFAGKVDAVSIAVPTAAHHEVASFFLAEGIDVLLEKPITVTLDEADKLVALARKNNLILQIGFVERFNPAIVALAPLIGKPLFIETHRLHPFFERGTDVDVILDLMVHDLDILLYFVNSPVSSVEAVGVSVLSDKVDIANARLTFASGCVANITASRVTGKLLQKTRFFGVEGYHAVDFSKRTLVSLGRRQSDNGKTEIIENPVRIAAIDPLEEEIRAFVRSVLDRTPPAVSGTDGRNALELALRINGAIETSRRLFPDFALAAAAARGSAQQ